MSGRVRMGAAKVNITPPVGTHLGGYGNRRRPSDDIHDELYAAAYVFADDTTTVAVIGADLVDFPLERTHSVRRKITALTGIPGSHVMLGATHAHSGPNTKDWGAGLPGASEPFPGGIPTEELTYALPILDLDYLDELENKLAGVVAMAMQGFQNVVGGIGTGQYGLAINRRGEWNGQVINCPRPDGLVDHSLPVLRFDNDAGEPAGIIFNYACHPTSMSNNFAISADYPGPARSFVEDVYGDDCVVGFLLGCHGDIRPNYTDESGRFRSAVFAELEREGRIMGAEVVKTRERIHPRSLDGVAAASTPIVAPFAEPPTAEYLREALESGAFPDTGRRLPFCKARWAQRILRQLEDGTLTDGLETELQVIRVGHLVFVGFPGEFFLEYGMETRTRVKEEFGLDVVHVSMANDMIGYVASDREIPRGGYEVGSYQDDELAPAHYRTGTQGLFVGRALELVGSILPHS
jgi:hypothetical protein